MRQASLTENIWLRCLGPVGMFMDLHTLPLVGHPQAAQKLWRGARRETLLSAVEEPRLQVAGRTALLRNRHMFLLT